MRKKYSLQIDHIDMLQFSEELVGNRKEVIAPDDTHSSLVDIISGKLPYL